ncbi:MAG: pilus assembly protein PilM [Deltaproteobacteria bacterium]|nr:pilus assembly protein PilM [Deltaproteobacteria bacterium]
MRIIALDIGSSGVKAIEMEAGIRSIEIMDFFEEKFPASQTLPSLEQIQNAITKIFIDQKINPPFKLVTALSGLDVSSRRLELPFKEKIKIKQTLPFELEEHIPFSLENSVYTEQIIASTKEKSQVLVLVTPKDRIEEHLTYFVTRELSPDVISADSVVLVNLSEWISEPPDPYAIVNIGRAKTNVCIVQEGAILNIRSIPIAGDALTHSIQSTYKLNYDEAEQAKRENGFVLTGEPAGITPDQKKFSDCLCQALDPLLEELLQTFQAHRSKGLPAVRKIYLTGKSAQLRNLPAYVAQELSIEVEMLNFIQQMKDCNIANNDEQNAAASTAVALGMGLVGRNFQRQFNFRKDSFSKYRAGTLSSEIRTLIAAGCAIIVILIFNVFGNYFIQRSTLRKLDRDIEAVLKKFPVKIDSGLLTSPTRMRAFLNKKSSEFEEKMNALGGQKQESLTVLQVLKEISGLVPKEVLFDVRELSIVDRKVRMKGISDSFNSVENIEKSLKNHAEFTNVVKGEIQTAADGKNKNFTVTFDLRKH